MLRSQADNALPTQNSGYRSLEEGQEVIYELYPERQQVEVGWGLTATRIEVKGWAVCPSDPRHSR